MVAVKKIPRPLADLIREYLQRVVPALAHNLSEERLSEWHADPEIRTYLASITCLDLSTIIITAPLFSQKTRLDLAHKFEGYEKYCEQNHLGVLLECTPELMTLNLGSDSGLLHLSWHSEYFPAAFFSAVGRLTNLQSLRLPCDFWNHPATVLADALCSLTQLVELDLRGNTIHSEEILASVLQHLTGLTKLKILIKIKLHVFWRRVHWCAKL